MLQFIGCIVVAAAPARQHSLMASRSAISRRGAILAPLAVWSTMSVPQPAIGADALSLETYTDDRYSVSFGLPKGFVAQKQELPDGRRLITATDQGDTDTNVFIAFTPIRPDYSSLGSFGTIDYVASTVIPQCGANGRCTFANGDAIEGKMLEQTAFKGNYVYDYTIEQKGGPKRHLRSLFSIKADGASSILVTLTAQCLESRHASLAGTFKDVIESFAG